MRYTAAMADKPPTSRLKPRVSFQPPRKGRTTLYISDENLELWTRAQQFAVKRGATMTSVVMDALARYLANPPE